MSRPVLDSAIEAGADVDEWDIGVVSCRLGGPGGREVERDCWRCCQDEALRKQRKRARRQAMQYDAGCGREGKRDCSARDDERQMAVPFRLGQSSPACHENGACLRVSGKNPAACCKRSKNYPTTRPENSQACLVTETRIGAARWTDSQFQTGQANQTQASSWPLEHWAQA